MKKPLSVKSLQAFPRRRNNGQDDLHQEHRLGAGYDHQGQERGCGWRDCHGLLPRAREPTLEAQRWHDLQQAQQKLGVGHRRKEPEDHHVDIAWQKQSEVDTRPRHDHHQRNWGRDGRLQRLEGARRTANPLPEERCLQPDIRVRGEVSGNFTSETSAPPTQSILSKLSFRKNMSPINKLIYV